MARSLFVLLLLLCSVSRGEIPANLKLTWTGSAENTAALERLRTRLADGETDLALGKRGTLSTRVKSPTKLDKPPRMIFPNRQAKEAWIARVNESMNRIRRGIELRSGDAMTIPPAWSISQVGDIAKIDSAKIFQVQAPDQMLVWVEGKPVPPLQTANRRQIPNGLAVRGTSEYLRAISDDNADEERRKDEQADDLDGMVPGSEILFMLRGVKTSGITDNTITRIGGVFVASGTTTYPTIAGTKTVFVLEPTTKSIVEEHWVKFRIEGRQSSKASSTPETTRRDAG